ncbi:MAG: hypothetical protein GAK28_03192 [Luteibacter sp.]|uniref:hypothetical protein n=1 Tax=Luteibacter sp. TaxID=1886636 RepID=UPI00137CE116|nr:hypothetical protein [Luteibacter sp.]KAF1005440.1 MAG: hypothetical protein GAK28_03192 [Luteibacter sp.]
MSALTLRQRAALHYSAVKRAGELEIRAKHRVHGPEPVAGPVPVASSTPTLQRFLDSGAGCVLLLFVGLAFLAWTASGGFV